MIEKQVQPEVLSSDFKRNLAPDKRKSYSQLYEKLAQVCQEFPFEVALLCLFGERQKIEVVGIFNQLLCEVGFRRRESSLKIRDCFPLPPIKAAFDLQHEHVSAPTVEDGLLNVPEAFRRVLHLVEQDAIVEPGQFCSKLLQKSRGSITASIVEEGKFTPADAYLNRPVGLFNGL